MNPFIHGSFIIFPASIHILVITSKYFDSWLTNLNHKLFICIIGSCHQIQLALKHWGEKHIYIHNVPFQFPYCTLLEDKWHKLISPPLCTNVPWVQHKSHAGPRDYVLFCTKIFITSPNPSEWSLIRIIFSRRF